MLCGMDCRGLLATGPSRCQTLSEDKVPILGQRAVDVVLEVLAGSGVLARGKEEDRPVLPCIALFVVGGPALEARSPHSATSPSVSLSPLDVDAPRSTLVFIGKVQEVLLGAGIHVRTTVLPADPAVCTAAMEAASRDAGVAGIVLGRPLPPACATMLAHIAREKDLDGALPDGSVVSATAAGAAGLVELLHRGPTVDRVVVIGHKGAVGSSVGVALNRAGISWRGLGRVDVEGAGGAPGLGPLLQDATIVVSAVGKAGLLTVAALSAHPRHLVVDVGWDGGVGDVHRDVYTAPGTTTFITPVPGGCGPLQMAVFLHRAATQLCRCGGVVDRVDGTINLLDVLRRAYGPLGVPTVPSSGCGAGHSLSSAAP